MINLYRNLVLFSYIVYAAFFLVPYFDVYVYNQETLDALSWTGYGASIELNNVIAYAFFIAYSIILFGLLFFKSWARPSFVAITLMSLIFTGLQGIEVFTAVDGVLSYITNLADGATIILMYFTSISSRFSKNA